MITLGADNVVVRHCLAGIDAERRGDGDAAMACYAEAWKVAADVAERCVAAHYGARMQPDAVSRLHWNTLALELAREAGDLDAFIPSLELNVGSGHEELGDRDEATRHYHAAAEALAGLGANPVAVSLAEPIDRALRRVASDPGPEC